MNKKWTITGDRIKIKLKTLKMTQRELAEKTGYTETTISRWVSSSRIPKGSDYPVLAKALECSCDYLLGLETVDDLDEKIAKLCDKGYEDIVDCLNHKGIEALYDVVESKIAGPIDFANILMGLFLTDEDMENLSPDYTTLISIIRCINGHPGWFNTCKEFTRIDDSDEKIYYS